MSERRAQIHTAHELPKTRRCELFDIARSSAYYRPEPIGEDGGVALHGSMLDHVAQDGDPLDELLDVGQGVPASLRTCRYHHLAFEIPRGHVRCPIA